MSLSKLFHRGRARVSGTSSSVTIDGLILEQRFLLDPPWSGWRGWVEIEIPDHAAHADGRQRDYFLALQTGPTSEVEIPVFPRRSGWIREVLRMSDEIKRVMLIVRQKKNPDQVSLRVKAKRLGRFEALWRVALRHRRQLSKKHGVSGILWLAGSLLKMKAGFKECLMYQEWIDRYDTLYRGEEARISSFLSDLKVHPKFSIVVPVYNTPPELLAEMIASVESQIYQDWELCLADDASSHPHVRKILQNLSDNRGKIKIAFRNENGGISAATNSALEMASGDFIVFLDHDDVLPSHALATLAAYIDRYPQSDIFYSDEDKLDKKGRRCDHFFKPDWNPERLYGQNYLNHLTVIRASLVQSLRGLRPGVEGSQDYDLVLRATSSTRTPIIHIPHILYHWRIYGNAGTFSSTQLDKATASARKAIRERFESAGVTVAVTEAIQNYHRVIRSDPVQWPKVSVIIPTRDCAELMKVCLRGLSQTDYPDIEIIVADNGSVEPETTELFEEAKRSGVKVIDCAGPFNYSHINNRAARFATGYILLLLNNDTEIMDAGWLKEMVRHLLQPDIGAVGAKLLYPDRTIQHAGVVLGMGGVAGHLYTSEPETAPGYGGMLGLVREVSCVTGACLAVKKSVFDAIGGLNELELQVAFNDVDLCIRIRQAGYRIIFTPFAVLMHHESKSRGSDTTEENIKRFQGEIKYMQDRWGDLLRSDPFYHPNLSLKHSAVELAFPPRITFPWRAGEN